MSLANIRTRIELETRVLAAALKQSFERGDADGVSLAHRQLFLLLKDQKPGNGASNPGVEVAATPSNGDSTTRSTHGQSQVAVEPVSELTDSNHEFADGQTAQTPQPSNQEESEKKPVAEKLPDTDPAVHQYLRYKQAREYFNPAVDHQPEEAVEENELTENRSSVPDEEDYTRMRKVEPPPVAELPFNTPSPEYAEVFGGAPVVHIEQPEIASAENLSYEPEREDSELEAGAVEASEYPDESDAGSMEPELEPDSSELPAAPGPKYHQEFPDYSRSQSEAPETSASHSPSHLDAQEFPAAAHLPPQSDAQEFPTAAYLPPQSDAQEFPDAAYSPAQSETQEFPAAFSPSQSDSQEIPAVGGPAKFSHRHHSVGDIQPSDAELEPHRQWGNKQESPPAAAAAAGETGGGLSAPVYGGFIEAEFAPAQESDQQSELSDTGETPIVVQAETAEIPSFDPARFDRLTTTGGTPALTFEIDDVTPGSLKDVTAPAPQMTPADHSALEAERQATAEWQALAADIEAAQALAAAARTPEALSVSVGEMQAAALEQRALSPQATESPEVNAQDDSAGEHLESFDQATPQAPARVDLYVLLGVSQMSPFEEIHKNFLIRIRKILLKLRGTVRPERDELLKELRKNWIARDILCDPVTRTDYDFREMGLRGSPDAIIANAPEDGPQGRLGQRTPLRIGELLQCAGLLEQAELEIACDMHKAMPEMQFGTFLVNQGFIQERDLESVLLGQKLLRDGNITVAQFQVAMELSQSRGVSIADILIDHGYVTAAQLGEELEEVVAPDMVSLIRKVPIKPRREPTMTNLTAASAVPTWKDQLDWSKPLSVEDEAIAQRDPEKQSLAELLSSKTENETAPSEPEQRVITNNAAPSWKDQLDWEKPEEPTVEQQPLEVDLPQANIDLSNALPSWKDQLDWEKPKEDEEDDAPQKGEVQTFSVDQDDQALIENMKITASIPTIQPHSSVAPHVKLGVGSGADHPKFDQEATEGQPKGGFFNHLLNASEIFEQAPIDLATTANDTASDTTDTAPAQVEVEDADEDSEDEEGVAEVPAANTEEQGFFKKKFGKFRKSVADNSKKDKKKKRK